MKTTKVTKAKATKKPVFTPKKFGELMLNEHIFEVSQLGVSQFRVIGIKEADSSNVYVDYEGESVKLPKHEIVHNFVKTFGRDKLFLSTSSEKAHEYWNLIKPSIVRELMQSQTFYQMGLDRVKAIILAIK